MGNARHPSEARGVYTTHQTPSTARYIPACTVTPRPVIEFVDATRSEHNQNGEYCPARYFIYVEYNIHLVWRACIRRRGRCPLKRTKRWGERMRKTKETGGGRRPGRLFLDPDRLVFFSRSPSSVFVVIGLWPKMRSPPTPSRCPTWRRRRNALSLFFFFLPFLRLLVRNA